jgi:predicted negative regulator of RcsB-dependent stress response
MLIPIPWLTEKLADKIASMILEKAASQLNLSSEIPELRARVDQLDEKIDRLLVAPLKAALTFLELGRFDQALDELVKADANEQCAPVTKFWLDVVSWHQGKNDFAIRECKQGTFLIAITTPHPRPVAFAGS